MGIYDFLSSYTAPALLRSALGKVSSSVDKREGSVIYDTLSPLSVVAANIISMFKTALENTDLQTATGEWLDLIGQQPPCGVYRKQATKASKFASTTPNVDTLANDTAFQSNVGMGLIWRISQNLGNGRYLLTCETSGAAPGGDYGELTPSNTISGLQKIVFDDIAPFNEGSDAESDYDFRLRIWAALKMDSYGGNFEDYKRWILTEINQIPGMPAFDGFAFFPASRYTGGGNICIYPTQTASNGEKYLPASDEACDVLKQYLDPDSVSGMGAGVSPVGHHIEVKQANLSRISFRLTVKLKSGYNLNDYKQKAFERINEYFESLRAGIVTKMGDGFPENYNATTGFRYTIQASIMKSYLIPEIEAFDDVTKIEIHLASGWSDFTSINYGIKPNSGIVATLSTLYWIEA